MGTWGVGPFDNDTAADWAGLYADAAPSERVALVSGVFAAVIDTGDDYLDSDFAFEAIAAAAVLAGQAPDSLQNEVLPADLRPVALEVLDRIEGDNSEWRDLWKESPEFDAARAALQPIRAALAER